MNRANYKWGRKLGVVWIQDLDNDDNAPSVTNDVERVIADLVQLGVTPESQPIVYVDSMGRWDRIRTRGGRFLSFEYLGAATLSEAVSRLDDGSKT
jgi:hypothetical protein